MFGKIIYIWANWFSELIGMCLGLTALVAALGIKDLELLQQFRRGSSACHEKGRPVSGTFQHMPEDTELRLPRPVSPTVSGGFQGSLEDVNSGPGSSWGNSLNQGSLPPHPPVTTIP